MLSGIPRGTTNLSAGRKILWAVLALFFWLMSILLQFAFVSAVTAAAAIGLLLAGGMLFAFLIFTGKRQNSGIEQAVFTGQGFGFCGRLNANQMGEPELTPWHTVNAVRLDQKGHTFFRLRLGHASRPGGRLDQTGLDLGVRCYPETAEWIRETLARRFQAAGQQPH